ncbi:MAG: class I SAM-dependent methyltransferase [Bacteroidales bacterium]|nr:class I SAM-dependent methyltransferase [Bacteroidales bacterium]
MSKISKAFKALSLILRQPALLNRVLQDPDYWEGYVRNRYDLKEGLPLVDPTEIFGKEYNGKLSLFTFLDGGSLVTDILLLKALAGTFEKCIYFEIGTWRGESAVNLADVAEEVFTLNISDEEMRAKNVKEGYISQQAYFSKNNKKIVHLRDNSANFDFSSPGKKFDLVFIDGSHHYEDVQRDTRNVFRSLLHENSVVVWHDYGITPEDVRYEVLAGILDGLKKEHHKYLYHVAHTQSAIFIRREMKTGTLIKPVIPDHFYSLDIKYNATKERNI